MDNVYSAVDLGRAFLKTGSMCAASLSATTQGIHGRNDWCRKSSLRQAALRGIGWHCQAPCPALGIPENGQVSAAEPKTGRMRLEHGSA
jgi:hypothetical protein